MPTAGGEVWLAVIPTVVLVHEPGHLAAAKAVGFEIQLFSIGPLVVRRAVTMAGAFVSTYG